MTASSPFPAAPNPALPQAALARWEPDRTPLAPSWPQPPLLTALGRGARARCPACGQTHMFDGLLRVVPVCHSCSAPLGQMRADDAPPYFTIVIVAHIVIPLMLLVQKTWTPSDLVTAAIFLPLTAMLSLALLRPIKGATVGLMLRLGLTKTAAEDDSFGKATAFGDDA